MSLCLVIKFVPFLLIITFHSASGIQCYRCLPKTTPVAGNQSVESCTQFDGSSKFKMDCPLSTFCMKRNFTLEFPDGRTAIVTERGCAHQSLSYRVLKRGQWQTVNDVNETVYQDGCILEHQTSKPPTQYCYCSSRLCNSAPSIATLNPFILLYLALICSSFTLL